MLFSISQKLTQHMIVNYTEILKWMRDILACRNAYLLRHQADCNIGSSILVCHQAHIKLEASAARLFGSLFVNSFLDRFLYYYN